MLGEVLAFVCDHIVERPTRICTVHEINAAMMRIALSVVEAYRCNACYSRALLGRNAAIRKLLGLCDKAGRRTLMEDLLAMAA